MTYCESSSQLTLQTEDVAWVVMLSKERGRIRVKSSPEEDVEVVTVERSISAGLNLLSCPLVGHGRIQVDFRSAKDKSGMSFSPDFVFNASPKSYNFNAFVAMYPEAEWV